MRSMHKLCILVVLSIILTSVTSEEEPPKKVNNLLRRPAGRINGFGKAATTPATTTTTQVDEYLDEIEGEEGEPQEADYDGEKDDGEGAVTTSTEAVKKVGPIIRPFRSNDDLLNALKRRQQNIKTVKKVTSKPIYDDEEENEPAPAVVAPKSLNERTARKRFGGSIRSVSPVEQQAAQQDSIDDSNTQTPVKRPGRSRFGLNKSA